MRGSTVLGKKSQEQPHNTRRFNFNKKQVSSFIFCSLSLYKEVNEHEGMQTWFYNLNGLVSYGLCKNKQQSKDVPEQSHSPR